MIDGWYKGRWLAFQIIYIIYLEPEKSNLHLTPSQLALQYYGTRHYFLFLVSSFNGLCLVGSTLV